MTRVKDKTTNTPCFTCGKPMQARPVKSAKALTRRKCITCRSTSSMLNGSPKPQPIEGHLPEPSRAQTIVDACRAGESQADAVRALGKSTKYNGGYAVIVRKIWANPDKYDTYIDEIAVERAFRGDRAVWQAMTYYEKAALIDLICDRGNAGMSNAGWPGTLPGGEGEHRGWIGLLSEQLGEDPLRFRKVFNARNTTARRKARA